MYTVSSSFSTIQQNGTPETAPFPIGRTIIIMTAVIGGIIIILLIVIACLVSRRTSKSSVERNISLQLSGADATATTSSANFEVAGGGTSAGYFTPSGPPDPPECHAYAYADVPMPFIELPLQPQIAVLGSDTQTRSAARLNDDYAYSHYSTPNTVEQSNCEGVLLNGGDIRQTHEQGE